MSTKSKILKILEENKADAVSGQLLASKAGVSRNAVWKAVQELKKEGYDIESVTNKGYTLAGKSDILSPEGIGIHLKDPSLTDRIYVYKLLESTSITAKKAAIDGAVHGTVIIAESQSAGKGRMKRKFESPAGSGLYMSMVLKPDFKIENAILITVAASVATARAIEAVTGVYTEIKWVNDLFLNGKKVCGILTEAVSNFETGNVESVILGIGINVTTPQEIFPEELRDAVGSVLTQQEEKAENISRNRLAAAVIDEVLAICEDIEKREFIEEYKKRSCILGAEIFVISRGESIKALAQDINQDGCLVVQYEDGRIETLNSGEISIRRIS